MILSTSLRPVRIPLAIFFLLCAVYLLTYNGLLRSIDELVLYSMTESLLQRGSLETPQTLFAGFHNPVGRPEPLQAIAAAPLYALAQLYPEWGKIQTLMLFNVLVTAATASLLWIVLRAMGYSPTLSLVGALIFGLATLSWPYSRTFFREPLVALAQVSAFLFLLRYRDTQRLGWAVACLGVLALAMATKFTSVVALPVFALALLVATTPAARRRLWLPGVALAVILGLLGTFTLWARWGTFDPLTLVRGFIEGGSLRDSLERIYGLVLSPGKGLLVYSPIFLAGLWGGLSLLRKRRLEALVILGVTLGYLVLYSRWYLWWGGLAWGPRFLVPLVPLLCIPVVEAFRGRWPLQIITGLVAGLSVLIQLVASTANYAIYYLNLARDFPDPEPGVLMDWTRFDLSPVLGQFRIWRPANFDLWWWRSALPDRPPNLEGTGLAVLVVLLLLALGYLVAAVLRPHGRAQRAWSLVAPLGFVLGTAILLQRAYWVDAAYWHTNTAELRQLARQINATPANRKLLVSVSNDFHYALLMNFLHGAYNHSWFSPLQKNGFEVLRQPMAEADGVLLATDHIQPGSPESALERWLNLNAYRYDAQWIGGYLLYRYAPPRPLAVQQEMEAHWEGGIELVRYGQGAERLRPGEPLLLEFVFRRSAPVALDYTLFVHLVDPSGQLVSGIDGPPQFGGAPTSLWTAESEILDRRSLLVPLDAPAGRYLIEIGFFRAEQRLPLRGAAGLDRLKVGELLVEA